MEESEGGVNIVDHTGSVTLVQNGKENILVDVGGTWPYGRTAGGITSKKGLKEDNIDLIILTHFHLDHAFNIGLISLRRG